MTPTEYKAVHDDMCNRASELTMRKNHDYGSDVDSLANLRACEDLGICTAETGVLVRLCDKFRRLIKMNAIGEAASQVPDETMLDTELDIMNYVTLFEALRRARAAQKTEVHDEGLATRAAEEN